MKEIFRHIFLEYGIKENLLEAIKSIYVGSKAAVRIDGEISDSFKVNEGVRHDYCLSPLLFLLYSWIRSLSRRIQ